ncbi:energy-coupling factor transporter ATPase [Hathewaya limosa]|uniref:Energy-coupling factor transporter ATP-binding protein EcfA2 n=1 Tax=Hathewaya limosa TaxID=1536 RepID=A0ABU0JQR4_HATLI|nr:energy-coupling factor transporter ATPase [Hathewaya limosa]MDQ0479437.1 energy-coupling factor transport system ATP-binding protein [Hathewaya limosa]
MFIKIDKLSYIYMQGTPFEKRALDNVNIEIEKGEFTAIIGHTGSGKSTLIQLFNGLLKPSEGTVFLEHKDIYSEDVNLSEIRKEIGLVFQYPEYQLFEETVEKDIAFGPQNLGLDEKEISNRVKMAMKMVGLSYEMFKEKCPFNLSGGQKRRVAIAGILAMKPKVLILDEPTAGLDPKGREDILRTIKEFHDKYNMNIILVSHSMEDVAKYAQKVIVMSKGKCVLYGEPKDIFKQVELLEGIGLSVPRISYLIYELNKKGFNINPEIYSIDELKEELVKVLNLTSKGEL